MAWPSPCVCRARPWPTPIAGLPCWGARGSVMRRRFAFSACILWFSGLFAKHRSRVDMLLKPFRSYLRYVQNGPCFIGFQGLLTLQTPLNVEGYHQKVLFCGPVGGLLSFPTRRSADLWHGRALVSAGLGHGRPP